MFRCALLAATLSLAVLPAYAGGVFQGYPTVPATQPLTGNELSPADTQLPSGQPPQTETISTQQYRAASYIQQTPVTGFTVTCANGTQLVDLTPAGTLATGTVILPPVPVDGQRWKLFSTAAITALTITPSGSQTINGTAVTTLAAGASVAYLYVGSSNTWFREL